MPLINRFNAINYPKLVPSGKLEFRFFVLPAQYVRLISPYLAAHSGCVHVGGKKYLAVVLADQDAKETFLGSLNFLELHRISMYFFAKSSVLLLDQYIMNPANEICLNAICT